MSRLILLGIGTAKSPRFAAAGLLVEYGHTRVGLDGGPGSEPPENIDAWLIRDKDGPLLPELRRLAREEGMCLPEVTSFQQGSLRIEPEPVVCADREVHGYRITSGRHTAVWAPEFTAFPQWSGGADIVFADAATRSGTPGDRLGVASSAAAAQRLDVGRLVFARLGETVFPAVDAGETPPFGEWGEEGRTYRM